MEQTFASTSTENQQVVHMKLDFEELVQRYLDVYNSVSNLFNTPEAMERIDSFVETCDQAELAVYIKLNKRLNNIVLQLKIQNQALK